MTEQQIGDLAESILPFHHYAYGDCNYRDIISKMVEAYKEGQKESTKWAREMWLKWCKETIRNPNFYPFFTEFFDWLEQNGGKS